jgi:hypothetical protein
MSLQLVYDYFANYRKAESDFEVFSALGSEASEADVSSFERAIGFRFPEEFREFSTSYLGCLGMVAKESIWPPPKKYEVGPFWSFLRGFMVFGFSKEAPLELSIEHRLAEFRKDFTVTELVPFMKLYGCADRFCFDSSGRIFEFQHDDPAHPEPIASSFSDHLMAQVRDLEERMKRKKTA